MKRIFVVLIAGILAAGLLSGDTLAGKRKKKTRKVEAAYATSALGMGGVEHVCPAEPFGCVFIPLKPGDKYVSLDIVDSSGSDVYASVYVYGYTDGMDTHEHVCTKTDQPLAVASGIESLAVVVVHATSVTANCEGMVTSGTVKATFSNIP